MVKYLETKEEFDAFLAANADKLVVVDFTASWCGPCKMIAPVFDKLSIENSDVVFVKVDVDENQDTAEEWEVQAMPTFICFKNKSKVDMMTGANEAKLRELVAKNK